MTVPSQRYREWKAKGAKIAAQPRVATDAVRHPNAKPFIEIPRCQAQTLSGEQCKHEASRGDFCALHRNAR